MMATPEEIELLESARSWVQGAKLAQTGMNIVTEAAEFEGTLPPVASEEAPVDGAAWDALVWVEGTTTRDSGMRRVIGMGETRWRGGPYTLMTQDTNPEGGGHSGAYVSGRIDEFTREGAIIRARGVFNADEAGQKAEAYVRNQSMTNVSGDFSYDSIFVEMEMGTMEVEAGEEAEKLVIEENSDDMMLTFRGVELTALTHVNVGAFGDAKIALTADGQPTARIVGFIQLSEPSDDEPLNLLASGLAKIPAEELSEMASALDKAVINGFVTEEEAHDAFRAKVEARG